MPTNRESEPTMKNRATAERKSDRELVVRRTFNGPPRIVFQAWTTPELLMRWWVPKSIGMTLVSCQVDARTGGSYRFEIAMGDSKPMAFFGKYLEVIPNARLIWTNEEAEQGPITTVTFEEKEGQTLLAVHDLYPTKEALDAAIASGELEKDEAFAQLDDFLVTLLIG